MADTEGPGSASSFDSLASFTALLERNVDNELPEFLDPLAGMHFEIPFHEKTGPAPTVAEDGPSLPSPDLRPATGSDLPYQGEVVPMASLNEEVAASSGTILSGIVANFSDHGIEWLSGALFVPVCDEQMILEAFFRGIKSIMQKESPPSIEAIREVLKRNTLACHLIGFAKEPWMNTVKTIWSEVRCLHEATA